MTAWRSRFRARRMALFQRSAIRAPVISPAPLIVSSALLNRHPRESGDPGASRSAFCGPWAPDILLAQNSGVTVGGRSFPPSSPRKRGPRGVSLCVLRPLGPGYFAGAKFRGDGWGAFLSPVIPRKRGPRGVSLCVLRPLGPGYFAGAKFRGDGWGAFLSPVIPAKAGTQGRLALHFAAPGPRIFCWRKIPG